MYVYIYIYISFYIILFINNYYQYRRSPNLFKKMLHEIVVLVLLNAFVAHLRIFRYRFQFGDFVSGVSRSRLLFCLSASLPLSLPLHPSFRSDYDLRFCSWWVWCCSYLYNLRSLSISAMYMLCFRIFLYSSIVCFALVIIVSIYIYIYI